MSNFCVSVKMKKESIKADPYDGVSFSEPPKWLLAKTEFQPWQTGKSKIWGRVESYYKGAGRKVFDNGPAVISESDRIANRLFVCWLYHWETAGIDRNGLEVAKSVESGRGYKGNGQLGGNPFFDLVHARALCDRQNLAAELFQKKYIPYLRQVAKRFDAAGRFDGEIPSWWGPFYMQLTGMESKNAKATLEKFRGYSGLCNWLRIALALFFPRFVQRETVSELVETELEAKSEDQKSDFRGGAFSSVEDYRTDERTVSEWNRLKEHLFAAFQKAKKTLSDDQWCRLYYHFGKKLQNQQIARLFGEIGSTTTRRREEALRKFRESLMREMTADPVLRSIGDDLFSTWGKETSDLTQAFFEEN